MHRRHGVLALGLLLWGAACADGVTFPARQPAAFLPSRPNTSGQVAAYGATSPGTPLGTSTRPVPVETTTTSLRRPPSRGQILTVLAALDRREIQLARLATTRATISRVRALAASLIADREVATMRREGYASVARVSYRPTPAATAVVDDTSDSLDELETLAGRAFDEAFLDAIVDHEEETIAFLDNQAVEATDDQRLVDLLLAQRRRAGRALEAAEALRDRLDDLGPT